MSIGTSVNCERWWCASAWNSLSSKGHEESDRWFGKPTKGTIKEAVGGATGDTKLKAEGKIDKATGKVQNAIGGLKDAARGI